MTDHLPPAPLHPTVQDLLSNSPAGPLLNQPVDQVLASLGIPPLPHFPAMPPMPGLPAMPSLDPATLFKPITDMVGHMGTGNLGSMGSLDPTQFFSQLINGFTEVLSLGSTAISLLTSLEGMGAQSATASSTAAQGDGASVSTQAAGISSLVSAAATAVQVGNAELAAIAAHLAVEVAATAAIPGGAAYAAAAAAESATEAAAVVAQVKAELGVLTTQMSAVGQPVPITNAPDAAQAATSGATSKAAAVASKAATVTSNAADSSVSSAGQQGLQELESLLQPITQLAQLAPTVAQQGEAAVAQQIHNAQNPHTSSSANSSAAPLGAFSFGAFAPPGDGGGLSDASAVSEPLGTSVVETPAGVGTPVAAQAAEAVSAEEAMSARAGAPMMPMGGGAGAGLASLTGEAESTARSFLVNAQHGDEVVGELEDVAAPVIGAMTQSGESVDKALTL